MFVLRVGYQGARHGRGVRHAPRSLRARTALTPRLTLQIVKRPGDLHTFQVLPRRWVVERTLAWITRCRRSVRDYEWLPGHHETIVYWAMTITKTRRLARRLGQLPPTQVELLETGVVTGTRHGRGRFRSGGNVPGTVRR
jgi:transposase